jgi:alpha/beta superfamily hydrolase
MYKKYKITTLFSCCSCYAFTVKEACMEFSKAMTEENTIHEVRPGYTEQAVSCRSGKNLLRGSLVLPTVEGRLPVVMMFHGFSTDKEEQGGIYRDLAQQLAKKGIASVRFNFGGTKDSDGEFDNMSVLTELADAEAILEYAKSLEFTDPNRIGAMGMSMGGVVCSLLAGMREEDLSAICLWAPAACMTDDAKAGRVGSISFDVADPPEKLALDRGFTVGRIFMKDAMNLDIYGTAKNFRKKVLLIQGEKDPVVDIRCAKRYMDSYRNGKLEILKGAGHGFFRQDREKINAMTCEFFARELQFRSID